MVCSQSAPAEVGGKCNLSLAEDWSSTWPGRSRPFAIAMAPASLNNLCSGECHARDALLQFGGDHSLVVGNRRSSAVAPSDRRSPCTQSQSNQFACDAADTTGAGLARSWRNWTRGPLTTPSLSLGLQRISSWTVFSLLLATDRTGSTADNSLERRERLANGTRRSRRSGRAPP